MKVEKIAEDLEKRLKTAKKILEQITDNKNKFLKSFPEKYSRTNYEQQNTCFLKKIK